MTTETALHQKHLDEGGKMVDFAGWHMPLHYGSQVKEHHFVRNDAGMFDVSHMTIIDLNGPQTKLFLQTLLANDVGKLKEYGKALYTAMLNPGGGVIDDLIVYYLRDDWFRIVVNAATRDKDLQWIDKQIKAFNVNMEERTDLSMLAIQGPNAREKTFEALGAEIIAARELKPFYAAECGSYFVARTGYTGEDGFEIMMPHNLAILLWERLLNAGVEPIGLGARDTLRLEAGMNLYGQDMDETVSPLEAAMGWTVAWEPQERNFIGRDALEKIKLNEHAKLVGLVLQERGVLRNQQTVRCENGEGVITSGGFSPTLNRSIAFARIPAGKAQRCQIEIRGKTLQADIVKPPFVRMGKSCIG